MHNLRIERNLKIWEFENLKMNTPSLIINEFQFPDFQIVLFSNYHRLFHFQIFKFTNFQIASVFKLPNFQIEQL